MNRILSLLALLLLAPAAGAAPTGIATLPLLNITGSGTVKPNLMLLYDNSGSMVRNYTPDYIADTTTCRGRATMAGGYTHGCAIGDPPFASADFNKQYYNPKVRYTPPVTATGASYPSMTRTRTNAWTEVTTDGFGINKNDLRDDARETTNLATGFPDLRWCDASSCGYNTVGYAYPDDQRYTAQDFTANPYYYTINVAEYCTDATLTNCRTTAIAAAAPAGYPVPAPVRWCDSRALTRCQAKYVGDYKYPRFSDPNGNPDWYGTITIGASAYANPGKIDFVTVNEPNGTFTITNGVVSAPGGTNTDAKRAAMADALAASIAARTGLAAQYTACVRTPTVAGVAACSSYGITLDSNYVVAVVPISCTGGVKSASTCTLVTDGSRAGRDLVVDKGTEVTALLTVTGTANGSKSQVIPSMKLGGTTLFSNGLTIAANRSAANIALDIKNKIGTVGTIRAYVGGTAGTPAACLAAASNVVCLVSTSLADEGDNITYGTITNNTKTSTTRYINLGVDSAVGDGVPSTATALGASVFVRTDIVPGRTYPRAEARKDCVGASCTYDEEMTNFANWYAYYKTRNQMMKTAVGQAFQPVADNYNVGIVSLSDAAAERAMKTPKPFSGGDRAGWYDDLYGMATTGSTPLRQALHAVGKMYANRAPYDKTAGNEVIQYPCQQNFTFVTTDGYWNGEAAGNVVNNDNAENPARFCSRAKGCVDTSSQTFNSLADVALYWYNGGSNTALSSLRAPLENWTAPNGLVAAAAGENTRLHMNTYALGLGVDGIMNYEPDYDTVPQPGGDFYKLITGVTSGCPWNANGAYVWPDPKTGDSSGSASFQSRVDDLWHAAINGHGKYFSASDPLQVIAGLRDALSNIEIKNGAAAAAATSTPNISVEDNAIYAATFTTVHWYGELEAKKIDVVTGEVVGKADWKASETVGRKAIVDSDGDGVNDRKIWMLNAEQGGLKEFRYDTLSDTEKTWFDSKCSVLAQCATLNTANRAIVNNGANIVNWLRGDQRYANDIALRAYTRTPTIPAGLSAPLPIVLGDIASSKPAYLREPRKAYTEADYAAYKEENADRRATVFVGANDGMVHAFDATTGEEMWAYAPRITMKKLHVQAGTTYSTNHQYSVDGSPEVADVKIGNEWHTVLVGGLNAGGRGFYALDVTDPDNPKALWEFCADEDICSKFDEDLGLSFGNPQFGTWKDAKGVAHWVVFLTSGYNNIPGTDGVAKGSGKGFLYVIDVATGYKHLKVGTTVNGSDPLSTPSGFARITAITPNPNTDPLVTHVYGGDNLGQMWRFDLTTQGTATPLKMGDTGLSQPITTRPDVTSCRVGNGLERVVAFGTGRLLDVPDVGDTALQSMYVLKDSGSTIAGASLRSAGGMARQSMAKVAGASSAYSINGVAVDLSTQNGWFVDFDQNAGERVNLDPKIITGALGIVTNIPSSSSSCKVGGTSNIYYLDVCTGKPLSNINGTMIAGETLSNTSAAVGWTVYTLPSGERGGGGSLGDGSIVRLKPPTTISSDATRAGWRRVRE